MNVLHYVSLGGLGGVELQFAEFLRVAAATDTARHRFVTCGSGIHPDLRHDTALMRAYAGREKYLGPLKVPRHPAILRRLRQRRAVRAHRPDVVAIWNRLRDSLATLAAAGDRRCLYWERGAAWFPGETQAKREFLRRVPAAICNSRAAKRMLQLRWGYAGGVRVCRNALRPCLLPDSPPLRSLPVSRPLRLGTVARLVPVKGVALAVHALAGLRRSGFDAVLHVAGDGPERPGLEALARRLGIADAVVFHGHVRELADFYRRIDCLMHPALREPFGQIVIEAAAYGCPAVAAHVDGLPETLAEGVSGRLVAPALPLSEYAGLGGRLEDLPEHVYDPVADRIASPRLVDPEALAAAVAEIFRDAAVYDRMCRAAAERVRREFCFTDHVAAAMAAMREFARTGALTPGETGHKPEAI